MTAAPRLLVAAALAGLVTAPRALEAQAPVLPASTGVEVATAKCLGCHEADIIVSQRLSPTGWDREVVETGAAAKAIKQHINQKVIYPDLSAGSEGLLLQSRLGRR